MQLLLPILEPSLHLQHNKKKIELQSFKYKENNRAWMRKEIEKPAPMLWQIFQHDLLRDCNNKESQGRKTYEMVKPSYKEAHNVFKTLKMVPFN